MGRGIHVRIGLLASIASVACGGSDAPSVNTGGGASGAGDGGSLFSAEAGAPPPDGASPGQPRGDGGAEPPKDPPRDGGSLADGASPGRTGRIPSATGACPTLVNGSVTVSPAGLPPRAVQIWMTDAAKTKHGPLVFYWHGTGSRPSEASYSLGATLNEITAAGGIVVAPTSDPNAGQFEWYLVSGAKDDDLRVADEVVACAMQSIGIDARQIHSMGMSAGGLQTTAVSFLRSSYIASVAIYSGGLGATTAPAYEDATNKFAAMVFHGGASDNVFNFDFQAASLRLRTKMAADGHLAIMCNHGRGHSVPTEAAGSVWAFFKAHPFGVAPSPYAGGLPQGFPTYCAL